MAPSSPSRGHLGVLGQHLLLLCAQGDQFAEEYLKINPNNKVPTIIDNQSADGMPMSVFESGAILLYLGEKVDRFLGGPAGSRSRHTVTQWLMFQMASVGPMFGQCGYFRNYARGSEEELRHGRERYGNETLRIYRVMEKRLRCLASPYHLSPPRLLACAECAYIPLFPPPFFLPSLSHPHPLPPCLTASLPQPP